MGNEVALGGIHFALPKTTLIFSPHYILPHFFFITVTLPLSL